MVAASEASEESALADMLTEARVNRPTLQMYTLLHYASLRSTMHRGTSEPRINPGKDIRYDVVVGK